MSNYLANLVTRSVQKETPLQPRPVSLFEPWPTPRAGGLPMPIPSVVGEENETWKTATSPPWPQTPPASSPIAPPQRAWQTAVRPSFKPPEPLPPTHRPEQSPTFITILHETAQQQTPVPLPTNHPTPTHITTTIHAVAQPQPNQSTTLPPATLPLPVMTVHPQTTTSNGRSPTLPSLPPITITPAQIIPATLPANKPAIHNSQFTIHPSPLPPQLPEPAPTVQVTIGRIEVRATPLPPAAREKKESPTMNLDEYLRQRNGGHR